MINKPPIHEAMRHLYFLYEKGYIEYVVMLAVLAEQYGVHHVDLEENELVCYQSSFQNASKTTIYI